MANFTMSTGGALSGTVTASIAATTSNGTVTTGDTTGAVVIPAGAIWIKIKAAGAVIAGDTAGPATVAGSNWYAGREETWEAVWDVNASDFIKLPSISINGNGSRLFYTYFS